MVEMEEIMKKILHSKDQTMDKKWPEYERVLKKFLMFQNRAKHHITKPPLPPLLSTSSGKAPRRLKITSRTQRQLSYLGIRKGKGGRKLDRVMSIMQLLRDGGVDWDERLRFIYPDGGVDEDSNVTDLLSDVAPYQTGDTNPPRG